ncbi:dapper2-like [Scleropages formosus]|uniref:Dapper2-like n=1 Tax=Scleropages formosus TaxID=113540 RepID=A0A0P7TKD5_SCLFO|nr:dapper2-like [Scleropages formosus]
MLSRRSNASPLSAPAVLDRARVGERLHAALAGLRELHVLREKQADMVRWALRAEPPRARAAAAEEEEEERRLEETLGALREQLSRLRRQDVGLKSHLQQLDQQISELKLDVCKASTEQLESDSRPSSGERETSTTFSRWLKVSFSQDSRHLSAVGFYDLSDGGSGSLSNSCTSVYSECLSSSQSSLLPHHHLVGGHSEASRRRSADESAAQAEPPRGSGVRLGSSRIRAGSGIADRAKPRPVSTGDLDKVLISSKSMDVSKSSGCHSVHFCASNPKYQSDLVSRNSSEVYRYPSPLHAVALQSPLFSLTWEVATSLAEPSASQSRPSSSSDLLEGPSVCFENRSAEYISELLQRNLSKAGYQSETWRDRFQSTTTTLNKSPAEGSKVSTSVSSLAPKFWDKSSLLHPKNLRMDTEKTGRCGISSDSSLNRVEELSMFSQNSYPAGPSPGRDAETKGVAVLLDSPKGDKLGGGEQPSRESSCPGESLQATEPLASSTNKGQGSEMPLPGTSQLEFVHAQFVPAGSRQVKVRQADRKAKAVKVKRRSSEKLRPSCDRGRDAIGRVDRHTDGSPKQSRAGRASGDPPKHPAEGGFRSCSESSVLASSLPSIPCFQAQGDPAPQPSKAQRAQPSRAERVPVDPGRKRQTVQKLQSAVETVGGPPAPLPPLCLLLWRAESSEGELSDFTANRFGDSESSQGSQSPSDSDSSLSLEEDEDGAGLVWAEAAVGPTAAGVPLQQPRPEPPACRIKASRALKKKIRRFQPAALKVMTMV